MKKKIVILALSACMIFSNACSGSGNQTEIPNGYKEIVVSDIAGSNSIGVGVEFDPHFLSQNVQKGVSVAEDWAIIESRVKKMEIDRFRVMLLPSWIEPFNDNNDSNSINWDALTLDNAEMQSLYKVLDLAEENGIDVNLTLWGAENKVGIIDSEIDSAIKGAGGHFLVQGNEGTNWVLGTNYPEEFAENFSMYIQHLLNKGYTCIKEVTPINEPDWSYQINGLVSFEKYKELCLALDARFRADNIRDKVLFNLSDNTDRAVGWLEQTMTELDEITDIYNSHTYIFGYESTNATISNWEQENKNLTRNTGKPHMIGEFGSNLTTGSTRQSDIDDFRRGVLIVRQMLNFYNSGAAGASYWVLCDEYYNYTDTYDAMMQLGLWKNTKQTYYTDSAYYQSIKEDYEVRPQYYAFSLMSKHIPMGAEVYPIYLNNDFAIGTAFKGENGKWVYVFANGNAEGESLKLAFKQNGSFEKYEYKEGFLPSGDNLIQASQTQSNVVSFDLAPQTVVVWVEK